MFRKLLLTLSAFFAGPFGAPVFLFLMALLAYGWALPWLGFYWDDFPISWIAHQYGAAGLARYFATNRPVWGLIYQATMPLLGETPWHWQAFAIFWRWAVAAALWGLLRVTWPLQAAWVPFLAATLALLFPSFTEQFVSVVYSHFFIVMAAFVLSLLCSVLALRSARGRLPLTLLGLFLSLVNLAAMEYFFVLELLRPLVLWAGAGAEPAISRPRGRLRQAVAAWIPSLVLFAAAGIWRAFLFPYQTQNYQPVLLQQLRARPLEALLGLAATAFRQIWLAGFAGWARIFQLPASELGARSLALYGQIVAAGALLALLFLAVPRLVGRDRPGSGHGRAAAAWQAAGIGAAGLALAGAPFWVTGTPVSLAFPADRFNLPFLFGSAIFLAGLAGVLAGRRGSTALLVALVAVAAGFAAGRQFQVLSEFRRDWSLQKSLFWQMSWRIPALEPGTTLISSELSFTHSTDNSLSAPLNWIYAPDGRSEQMAYIFYYPSVRLGSGLPEIRKGLAIDQDYLAARFHGNTDQVVAVYYNPPGCLRVLDSVLDANNWMVPVQIRAGLPLASTDPILPGPAVRPPAAVFGAEPSHGWCYYFEKADLARQQGDWGQVAALGDQAFALGDYPNDPAERLPFIEGYAHTGNWERALELSREAHQVTPLMDRVLCAQWERIAAALTPNAEAGRAIQTARQEFRCKP